MVRESRDMRVKLEQAAETITAANRLGLRLYLHRGKQEQVSLALVVPFKMVMSDVLVQRQA